MVTQVFGAGFTEPDKRTVHPKIEVRAAGKKFHDLEAVSPLSFSVERGEFVAILGSSGCGKSTILSMLAGLERPSTGELYADGLPVCGPDRSRALIFQADGLLPWRTVEGNVSLGLEYAKIPEPERKTAVNNALRTVGLEEFSGYFPHQLSGGMRQRASLARSFVMDPDILLMDEPFGSLDAITRLRMHRDLLRLWEDSGKTVLMVTHDVDEALSLADRIIVLSPRPANIVSDARVRLSRPREHLDPEYGVLRHRLLHDLGLE